MAQLISPYRIPGKTIRVTAPPPVAFSTAKQKLSPYWSASRRMTPAVPKPISCGWKLLSAWSAAKLLLSPATELWKKIVAMLAMCVMASGFLEPYLFITNVYYHVTDFMFFFLTGYLDFWSNCKQNNQ